MTKTHPPLTLKDLADAVSGTAAAIRSRTRLVPAGGDGEKIFPPTYATGDRALRYALEDRRIDGQTVKTVLLDSVASQANRMEEALFDAWESKELDFPVIGIDFSSEEGIADLDRITTLHAPHRIADALLRDSVLAGDGGPVLFRDTPAGQAFTNASVRCATAVFRYCPTALVFGVWDSTGPRGGQGNKFQRALVSEVVGVNAIHGKKVGSRLDPAAILSNVPVYHLAANEDDWTIDEATALKKGGKPVPFSRKGSEGKGKPSAVNHSNVAPTIDEYAGGVTIDYALQTTVLSLPALRRLRFPVDASGKAIEGDTRLKAEVAARAALAALGLAAMAYQRARGHDFRSRCALVADAPFEIEIVPGDGSEPIRFSLDTTAAKKLLSEAGKDARSKGFGWDREPLALVPARKLADLIRKSRSLAAEGIAEGSE